MVKKRNFRLLLPEETRIPDELKSFFDLAFRDGNNMVVVKIVCEDLSPAKLRRTLNNEVVKLTKLMAYAEKVYLALPEELVSPLIIDGKTLSDAGIGLFIVKSQGDVIETVPAKPQERPYPLIDKKLVQDIENRLNRFEERLDRVSGKLNEFIRRLKILEEDLNTVKAEVRKLSSRVDSLTEKPIKTPGGISKKLVRKTVKEAKPEIPEFIIDNPWLDVLGQRGGSDE